MIKSHEELTQAYVVERREAITYDSTALSSRKTRLRNPDEHVILPERLSKEPLALTFRISDDRFREDVGWTVFTLINAEELGVTKAKVREMLGSPDLPFANVGLVVILAIKSRARTAM